MARPKTIMACSDCGQATAQWVGRCPGCGAWGSIAQVAAPHSERSTVHGRAPIPLVDPGAAPRGDQRISCGSAGIDRVLGGGLVPASVSLLAGEPGIGKSTLLLQIVAHLSAGGSPCLLVSGEESHAQVAGRAGRLGITGEAVSFAPGRDLDDVLAIARSERPFLLAVDSIQAVRDTSGSQVPGGVSQVRMCTDALVGLAKAEGIAVMLTGHVTKDGDVAGPRALEHAVDVVLSFDGDPRSGLRVLSGGKNRFGPEGETAWFEMGGHGLTEIDPTSLLVSGERAPGAATGLPRSGRRALAVEVQALVGASQVSARRQTTGLDPRRFQLVAAVLDRLADLSLGRCELFGASCGGVRVDDPACDLAVAAALTSAATGAPPPDGAAFVGEIALTGRLRAAPAMAQRLAAARSAGCRVVYLPTEGAPEPVDGLRVVPVRDLSEALAWALPGGDLARRSA